MRMILPDLVLIVPAPLVTKVLPGSVPLAYPGLLPFVLLAQMEQVTLSIAAHAQECASVGDQLSAQMETLRAIVEELTG